MLFILQFVQLYFSTMKLLKKSAI